MNNIEAVIFDLDDTLYDERQFVFGAFGTVAHYLSKKFNIAEESAYSRMVSILETQGRGKIFDAIIEAYSINESVEALVSIYREARPQLKLYADSERMLNSSKDKIKLGIITDGFPGVQWNKIRLLGLDKIVDAIVVSDDLGIEYRKPHTLPYKAVLEKLKVDPQQAVYIGDNPGKDFYGAKSLGVYTIRIIREHGAHMKAFASLEYEADEKIHSLDELEVRFKGA